MNFFILAAGRSGSTLLVNSLSSHPNIRCHHEPFNQHGWHSDISKYNNPGHALDHIEKHGLTIPLYIKLYSLTQKFIGRHKGKIAIDPFKHKDSIKQEGFKITWAQAASMADSLESWLSKPNPKRCIYLYRYDFLARFVSYKLARANGIWNSSYKSIETEPFKLLESTLQEFVEKETEIERQMIQMLAQARIETSALSYEDLAENPTATINKQYSFLGCPTLPKIKLVTKKVVNTALSNLVLNFDELPVKELNENANTTRLKLLQQI